MLSTIPAYIINLANRADRKANIQREFSNRQEFDCTLIDAIYNPIGAIGLWQSIIQIVRHARKVELPYVLICEDDHVFTADYSKSKLISAIIQAKELDADVLLGGVHWLTNCIPVTEQLYWVEKFSGFQFTVIFSKFYESILSAEFHADDAADYKISSLSDKIYFTFPFISTQKYFGYSDVTPKNNEAHRVERLFKESATRVLATNRIIDFYKETVGHVQYDINYLADFLDIQISAYTLNPTTELEQKKHIISEFENRAEFDLHFIEPSTQEKNEVTYLSNLQLIIKKAVANDDDVIIVCDTDHQFTETYSRAQFIYHVLNLYQRGVEVLCGGVDDFDMAVPVTKDKFWVGAFNAASFMVLYKSVFEKILRVSQERLTNDCLFRELTSNKMLLFPFVSTRKAFVEQSTNTHTATGITTSRLAKIHQVAVSSSLI